MDFVLQMMDLRYKMMNYILRMTLNWSAAAGDDVSTDPEPEDPESQKDSAVAAAVETSGSHVAAASVDLEEVGCRCVLH